jgi:hypothetical protein
MSTPFVLTHSLSRDSSGNWIDVDAASHAYTYNPDGTLATDTASNGPDTWVKTYTYTAGNLTGETKWVKQ